MARRGRPTSAAAVAARLPGSAVAKERAAVLLENLAGRLGVAEACRRLGLSRTLFWNLRAAALAAVLQALEPRPPGRPRRAVEVVDPRLRELEAEVARLQEALSTSRVREEIALCLPQARRRLKKSPFRGPRTSATERSLPPGSSTTRD